MNVILRIHLKFGERAFSVASPRASNRLPTELKLMRSTPVFKCSLKTFLFQTAYCAFKLDSVMRHRSSCRRRTKSAVDYDLL